MKFKQIVLLKSYWRTEEYYSNQSHANNNINMYSKLISKILNATMEAISIFNETSRVRANSNKSI